MFRWGLQTLTFSGGQRISAPESSLFIIVGPNNSGKTTALKDIHTLCRHSPHQQRVVTSATHFFNYQGADEWFHAHYGTIDRTDGIRVYVTPCGQHPNSDSQINVTEIANLTRYEAGRFSDNLASFMCRLLDIRTRLDLVNPVPPHAMYEQAPQSYIHLLQLRQDIATKVSRHVRAAFGHDLVINWGSGQVRLHLGQAPQCTPDNDRVSEQYIRAVNRLPMLHEQGEGVRSFVATLLASECGSELVWLIDEPEMFLHPPQARRLGEFIATTTALRQRQTIVATHSSDFIEGALSTSIPVAICRLTRDGDINHATLLDPDRLREFWSKPLLRLSSAVAGVFHEAVVVCESYADCIFYNTILRDLETRGDINGPNDFYFIHGGGKGELPTLVTAYRALNIPVVAVADLDMLRNEVEFTKLLAASGTEMQPIRACYNATTSALQQLPPITSKGQLINGLRDVISQLQQADRVDSSHRRSIGTLIDTAAVWSEAKRTGIHTLRGGARSEAVRLIQHCQTHGVFLVPFGALESWWPEGPATDKLQWILQALTHLENSATFHRARLFVAAIAERFGKQTTLDTSTLLQH